ncbi:hypothetical protein ANN_05791 [Periplaneta americana]|uniref:B box-type domain-containing protein n=1 Tax=Periplaneta americana TaxID=6978 RepID=A0ABQ8TDW1_PERAM|nr:hypothetical protein ANN_05791 [Periplaneta americana]
MKVPTVKGKAKNVGNSCNPLQVWECLFTEDMITEIVVHTNEKISSYRANFSDTTRTELRDTNAVELRALFGFLYYTAVFKSNHKSLESMFATDSTGRDVFRAILSVRRTYILIYCLRFDDFATRATRKEIDPCAAVSYIFHNMVENSHPCYNICSYACVAEMLVGFRGHCKFRVYMASKLESEETCEKSKRKRCALCPHSKEKKTNQYCVSCDRPVCQACRSVTCRECGE